MDTTKDNKKCAKMTVKEKSPSEFKIEQKERCDKYHERKQKYIRRERINRFAESGIQTTKINLIGSLIQNAFEDFESSGLSLADGPNLHSYMEKIKTQRQCKHELNIQFLTIAESLDVSDEELLTPTTYSEWLNSPDESIVPQVGNLFEELCKMPGSFNCLPDEVKGLKETLSAFTMDSIGGKTNELFETLKREVFGVLAMAEEHKPMGAFYLYVVAVIYCTRRPSFKSFTVVLMSIAYGIYVMDWNVMCEYRTLQTLMSLHPWCNENGYRAFMNEHEYQKYKPKAEPQDGLTDEEFVGIAPEDMESIYGLLAGGFSLFISRQSGKNIQWQTKEFITTFGRVKMGIADIAKCTLSLLESSANKIAESHGSNRSIKFIRSNHGEIDKFCRETRKICLEYNRKTLIKTNESYMKIVNLEVKGLSIQSRTKRDPSTSGILTELTGMLNNLKMIILDFERSNFNMNGVRQEPVGIKFMGGPGTGKSVAMTMMNHSICGKVLKDQDLLDFKQEPSNFIYNRVPESIYWDGYTYRALITCIDDFGQAKDIAGSPDNEFMAAIRCINSYEAMLHCAAMELKGKLTFQSKFFFITTNQQKFDPKSIVSASALNRRFTVNYCVVPKAEYCANPEDHMLLQTFDTTKLPKATIQGIYDETQKGIELSNLNPDVWDFIPIDDEGNPTGDPVSFEEVERIILKKYTVNKQRYELNREEFDRRVEMLDAFEFEEESECDTDLEMDDVDNEDSDEEWNESLVQGAKEVTIEESVEMYSQAILILREQRTNSFLEFYNDKQVIILMLTLAEENVVRHALESKDPHFFGRLDNPLYKLSKFKSCLIYLEDYLKIIPGYVTIRNFLVKYGSSLCKMAVTFATGTLVYYLSQWLYKWFYGKDMPEAQSFAHTSKMKSANIKTTKFVRNSDAVKAMLNIAPQAGNDLSGLSLAHSLLKTNVFTMQLKHTNEFKTLGYVTFIRGNIAIMSYHFILVLLDRVDEPNFLNCKIRLTQNIPGNDSDYLFSVKEIIAGHQTGCLTDFDLCLVEFPRKFQPRRDRIDCFAKREDYSKMTQNMEVMLPVQEGAHFYHGKAHAVDEELQVSSKETGTYSIRKSYQYDIPTMKGDCGAPMILLNNRIAKRKIFGFHAAGNSDLGIGFAAAICQEDILEDLALMNPQPILEVPDLVEAEFGSVFDELNFTLLGTTSVTPSRNTYTDIVPSLLRNTYCKSDTIPAKLRPFESEGITIDPLHIAQKKYCKPDVYIDGELLEDVNNSYWIDYSRFSKFTVNKHLLTVDEILYGDAESEGINGIPSSTSAGYPMNTPNHENIKKRLFAENRETDDYIDALDEFKIKLAEYEELYKDGIRPYWLNTGNLKNERIVIEKALKGKARYFCGGPFYLLSLMRKYFGSFSQHFYLNRVTNGSASGVNPYSTEWDILAKKLSQFNPDEPMVGAGDYSGFDSSEKPQIHNAICDGINAWYDDGFENAKVRELLFLEITNSQHIIDGKVYEWFSSLPSGNYLTLVLNTIYNHIAFRLCFHDLTGITYDFSKYCYVIALGDDNVFAVHDDYKEIFNEMTLVASMEKIGLTYTTELKQEATTKFRPLDSIEFLKRAFVFDKMQHQYVAPLRLSVVLEVPQWTRRGTKRHEIVVGNVSTAISELSLHPKEVYDKYVKEIGENFIKNYPNLKMDYIMNLPWNERRTITLRSDLFF